MAVAIYLTTQQWFVLVGRSTSQRYLYFNQHFWKCPLDTGNIKKKKKSKKRSLCRCDSGCRLLSQSCSRCVNWVQCNHKTTRAWGRRDGTERVRELFSREGFKVLCQHWAAFHIQCREKAPRHKGIPNGQSEREWIHKLASCYYHKLHAAT